MPGAAGNINSPGRSLAPLANSRPRDPIPARQLHLEQLENSTSSALYPDSGLGEAEEDPGAAACAGGHGGIGQGSKNME